MTDRDVTERSRPRRTVNAMPKPGYYIVVFVIFVAINSFISHLALVPAVYKAAVFTLLVLLFNYIIYRIRKRKE